jgi:diamine N-acetyltransferase
VSPEPTAIALREVGPDNWRACAALEVATDQQDFVAPVTRYLAMCAYGDTPWRPLAVEAGGRIVGFAIWAVDPDDGSFWIGGLVVDRAEQRKGYGRAIVLGLLERARAGGHPSAALSYQPANIAARTLYADLGFTETGEPAEDGEVVARIALDASPDGSADG